MGRSIGSGPATHLAHVLHSRGLHVGCLILQVPDSYFPGLNLITQVPYTTERVRINQNRRR